MINSPEYYVILVDYPGLQGYILWWEDRRGINQVLAEEGKLVVFKSKKAALAYCAQNNLDLRPNIPEAEYRYRGTPISRNRIEKPERDYILDVSNLFDDISNTIGIASPTRHNMQILSRLDDHEEVALDSEGIKDVERLLEDNRAFSESLANRVTVYE